MTEVLEERQLFDKTPETVSLVQVGQVLAPRVGEIAPQVLKEALAREFVGGESIDTKRRRRFELDEWGSGPDTSATEILELSLGPGFRPPKSVADGRRRLITAKYYLGPSRKHPFVAFRFMKVGEGDWHFYAAELGFGRKKKVRPELRGKTVLLSVFESLGRDQAFLLETVRAEDVEEQFGSYLSQPRDCPESFPNDLR